MQERIHSWNAAATYVGYC